MSGSKKLILVLSALFISCQEPLETGAPKSGIEDRFLLKAEPGDDISRATLQMLARSFGQDDLATRLRYDVKSFTVTYSTNYQGRKVEASGLMMIPASLDTATSIINLQHGTEFRKGDAPSLKGGLQGLEFFASAGYVTVMPDFLGYGASDSIFHPYYDRQYAAAAVIDMVKAVKEFLYSEGIETSQKLFLAGYSEGGYVTLAAAKEIDENPGYGLKVAGVAAGAGGYDLSHMLSTIISDNYYSYPAYLAFVLMSYNETYNWGKPLSYFFQKKYADVLAKMLDGSQSGGFINSKLTTHVPSLLNPAFLSRLKDPEGELELKKALFANSVTAWKTELPIRLFHGKRDEIIPYQNSQLAYEKFKEAGSSNVSLTLFPGGTHGNAFQSMLIEFVPWFLAL